MIILGGLGGCRARGIYIVMHKDGGCAVECQAECTEQHSKGPEAWQYETRIGLSMECPQGTVVSVLIPVGIPPSLSEYLR